MNMNKRHRKTQEATLDWQGVERCDVVLRKQSVLHIHSGKDVVLDFWEVAGVFAPAVPLMTGNSPLNYIYLPQSVIRACHPTVNHDLVY
jgi:hypothetical protein